jgi:hypothetical protein
MRYFNLKESDKDPRFNSFVKIEAFPKNEQSYLITPVNEWTIIVDEESIPSWYENDRESYETIIRKEASSWLNKINTKHWDNESIDDCFNFAYTLKYGTPNIEKQIATNPRYSYFYARDVLKGPFKLGEATIAKNASNSYLYARDVLDGPFPLGEKAIAKNGWYSYYYAQDALKRRFKLGEKIIATDAFYSYFYAKNVLKGRFILGEDKIFKSKYKPEYLSFIKPKITNKDLDIVNKYLKKNKKKAIDTQMFYTQVPAKAVKLLLNT